MIESLLQGAADLFGIGLPSTAILLIVAAWYLWRGKRVGGSVVGLASTAVRDSVFIALALAALIVTGVASIDWGAAADLGAQLAGLGMDLVEFAMNLLDGGV